MSLEKLYTIEVRDAFKDNPECPFCSLEAMLEKQALDFTLGSSYMESDVREQTDQMGFCRDHMEKMYQYGNALGNAWILKTRLTVLRKQYREFSELAAEEKRRSPAKIWKLPGQKQFGKKQPTSGGNLIAYREDNCFVCQRIRRFYEKMTESFLYLMINDEMFTEQLKASKGFCMRHFPDLLDACEKKLSAKEKEWYIPILLEIMNDNLDRIQQDLDWFIEKFDYRNQDADWKESKDALPRAVQKINGIF